MTIAQRQALNHAVALAHRAESICAHVCQELERDGQDQAATVVASAAVDFKRVAEQLCLTPTKPGSPN